MGMELLRAPIARLLQLSLILALLFASTAFAGTCHYYSYGGHGVSSCENGSFQTWSHGRHREYGIQNGGFERYPGLASPIFRMNRRRHG